MPIPTAAQIWAELRRRKLDRGTSKRTVERILGDLPEAPSAEWSIASAPAEDLVLVLPVGRALAEQDGGRPTAREAEWIVRIRRACPDLEAALRRVGLPPQPFHHLRHAYATRADTA